MRINPKDINTIAERVVSLLNTNENMNKNASMTLGELLARYLRNRTDIRSATRTLHKLTARYLKEYFGSDTSILQITRAMASDWRTALAKGQFSPDSNVHDMAEASVCIHVRNARTIFNHAFKDELVPYNPFDRLRATAPAPEKNWKYVTVEDLDKLLYACPNMGWKLLIALCRLAGLRRGEAGSLTWDAVDWENHRLVVIAKKTGRRRIVPIEAKLYQLLVDELAKGKEGQQLICEVSPHCLWRDFQKIRKRAGLPRWKDAFQVLRRNCETDWAQKYPQYAVSAWLGHSIKVSARHYLQIPEELYDKVAGGGA